MCSAFAKLMLKSEEAKNPPKKNLHPRYAVLTEPQKSARGAIKSFKDGQLLTRSPVSSLMFSELAVLTFGKSAY